jgi:hypothetical protein
MILTTQTKVLIIALGIFFLTIGWAPWLSSEKARSIVRTYPNFQEQHRQQPINDERISVAPTPFCRAVTTYEGLWWVCFWQKLPSHSVAQPFGELNLPRGYTLDHYRIEKITTTSCAYTAECVTPLEYQILSSCPYISLCLQNTCTVVCPGFNAR